MTVSSDNNRWSYTASGSNATFAYDNLIFADTDLEVYLNGVLQASGYSVTNVGVATGGNVVFDSNPTAATTVLIVRAVPTVQPTEFLDNGRFPAGDVEEAMDRAVVLAQQNDANLSRALRQPIADTADIGRLPDKDLRKGKLLGFDATTGDPAATTPTTTVVSQATETTQGIVELATTAEAAAGVDTARVVTPAGLIAGVAALVPDASITTKGKVEIATTAELNTGTDTGRVPSVQAIAQRIGWQPLARFVPTAAATFLISGASYFASTYSRLRLNLTGIQPATDNDTLWVRVTQGGTAKSGGTDYDWQYKVLANSASSDGIALDASDSEIEMHPTIGNATGEHVSGTVEFEQAAAASMFKFLWWNLYGYNGSQVLIRTHGEGNYRTDGNAIDGLQFRWSSGGNFAAIGSVFLEGLRET